MGFDFDFVPGFEDIALGVDDESGADDAHVFFAHEFF